MKFFNLYIDFEPSWTTYNNVTSILAQIPAIHTKSKFDKHIEPSLWSLQLTQDEDDPYLDFINFFMDLLEPKFEELKGIGIGKANILIRLVYEYDIQCSLEFDSQELKRLGENGISFNIDCFNIKDVK